MRCSSRTSNGRRSSRTNVATDSRICKICDGEFSIETEGGRTGHIGILSVNFCVTCFAGIMDFSEAELFGYDEGYIDSLFERLMQARVDGGHLRS